MTHHCVQLLWGGSGSDRLDLAQDTHVCGSMRTCLLLEAILMDTWDSTGALVLLIGVATPPFRFPGLSKSSFMAKRGTFIQSPALNPSNNSEGSAGIIFMPVVGTRDVSWGTVADLWVELKNLDNVILSPASSFLYITSQALSYLSPLVN